MGVEVELWMIIFGRVCVLHVKGDESILVGMLVVVVCWNSWKYGSLHDGCVYMHGPCMCVMCREDGTISM